MLWHVMSGETSLSTFLSKKRGEVAASKLTAMSSSKTLHVCAVLCLCPSRKCLVSAKGFIFGAKNLKPCKARIIVGKSHIVLVAPKTQSRRRPPDISVDLSSKRVGKRSLPFLANCLASCLSVLTRITSERGKVIY